MAAVAIIALAAFGAAGAGHGDGIYIVELAEPGLARHAAEVQPRSSVAAERRRLDPGAARNRAYLEHLDGLGRRHLDAIDASLGRAPQAVQHYRVALHGMALGLTAEEAERLRALPEVRRVIPDRLLTLDTDAGPAWVAAPEVWRDGVAPVWKRSRGAGIVVGVIDTGIHMRHPSFSDQPPDGHVFANPFGAGNFVGWCDPGHPQHHPDYQCNDKLIGAWDFADAYGFESDGPEDGNFHGTLMAGIAAGNTLDWPPVSGVAPHANLISYDVCFPSGGQQVCPVSAIGAAVDQAILDGVDVINISIRGGLDPWNDVDRFLLGAVEAGIFVAGSAGNTGSGQGTVGHRGPWVATVAATSHHRVANRNALVELTGGASLPPPPLGGISLTGGHGPAPLHYAGDCSQPFPPATWSQAEIVVCDFTTALLRWTACQNAAAGGAGGCVLGEVASGPALALPDFQTIPATLLKRAEADALRLWLATGGGHQGRLTPTELIGDPEVADLVPNFSSRGPNPVADILKPDIAAPGATILGPFAAGVLPGFTGDPYFWASGTSMSSAFVAGAGTLLRAIHPSWSPAMVRSALTTTSRAEGVRLPSGAAANPFARGAGRLDIARAAQAGVVLDQPPAAYGAADPELGGDPAALNEPSLVASDCQGSCSWQRQVLAAQGQPAGPPGRRGRWLVSVVSPPGLTVTVTPGELVLTGGRHSHGLEISVAVEPHAALGQWAFGEVVLTPRGGGLPEARLPLAVRPTQHP